MPSFYNNIVKQRSREKLKKSIELFIKKTGLSPSEIKVLCLPGEEALELYQVTDPLGIERRNIVCIERVRSVYDALVSKGLGCEINYCTVNEYLSSNRGKNFHIVSLDYMGHISSHDSDLTLLARNENMADDCLVFTNFCGAREKLETKALYYSAASKEPQISPEVEARLRNYLIIAEKSKDQRLIQKIANEFETLEKEAQRKRDSLDLDWLRTSIWTLVKQRIASGKLDFVETVGRKEFNLDALQAEFIKTNEDKYKEFEEQHPGNEHVEMIKANIQRVKNNGTLSNKIIKKLDERALVQILKISQMLFFSDFENRTLLPYDEDGKSLSTSDEFTVKFDDMLPVFVAAQEFFKNAHSVVHSESYRYVGRSGMPMYVDIFHLKRLRSFEFMSAHLNESGETIQQIFAPLFLKCSPKKVHEVIKQCTEAFKSLPSIEMPMRVNLGYESLTNPEVHSVEVDQDLAAEIEISEAEATGFPVEEETATSKVIRERTKQSQKGRFLSDEDEIVLVRDLKLKNPNLDTETVRKATGIKTFRIAAVFAHYTRGTYDHLKPKGGSE